MLKILSAAGTKVQGICSQAKSKIQATFSRSIEKIKACAKIIFAACASAQARIFGLGLSGLAGRKAIVLVARNSEAGLDGTSRKAPQQEATGKVGEGAETVVEASTLVVVAENKPAPVLSKMERVKQAVKDGSATVAKAIKDHPHISAAVIAAGIFGVGKVIGDKLIAKQEQAEMSAWSLLTDSSAGAYLAFDKTPEFREDPSFKAAEFARTFDNDSAVNEPFVGAFKIPDAYMTYLSNEHFETSNSLQAAVEGAHLRYPVSVGANNRWKWQTAEARHADIESAAQRKAHAEEVRKFLASIPDDSSTESSLLAPESEPTFAFEGPGQRTPDPELEKAIAEECEALVAKQDGLDAYAAFFEEGNQKMIFGRAKETIAKMKADKVDELARAFEARSAERAKAAADKAEEEIAKAIADAGISHFNPEINEDWNQVIPPAPNGTSAWTEHSENVNEKQQVEIIPTDELAKLIKLKVDQCKEAFATSVRAAEKAAREAGSTAPVLPIISA